MAGREDIIRISANANDSCPVDITGITLDACSTITNASKADITSRIYAVAPTYNVTDSTLPVNLQNKLDTCVDGVCNFVSYDFNTDTGELFADMPYVINTRPTTKEDTAVVVKKKQATVSSIQGDGTYVTVTTTESHGFQVGGTVNLAVTPYTGEFVIESVPSSTTFTYKSFQPCEGGTTLDTSKTPMVCTKPDYTILHPRNTIIQDGKFINPGVLECPTCSADNTCADTSVHGTSYNLNYTCRAGYTLTKKLTVVGTYIPDVYLYYIGGCLHTADANLNVRAIPACSPYSTEILTCPPEGKEGQYTRIRVSGDQYECKDLLTYIPDSPVITSSSKVNYVPSTPVNLSKPIGYGFNTTTIAGNQIGTTETNSTQVSCGKKCDDNSSCVGFNFSPLDETCQLYSSVTSDVNETGVSFRKSVSTSRYSPGRVMVPEYSIKYTNECRDSKMCNQALQKMISAGVEHVYTDDIDDCAYCPPRSFDKQPTRLAVLNELGIYSYFTSINDAISNIQYPQDNDNANKELCNKQIETLISSETVAQFSTSSLKGCQYSPKKDFIRGAAKYLPSSSFACTACYPNGLTVYISASGAQYDNKYTITSVDNRTNAGTNDIDSAISLMQFNENFVSSRHRTSTSLTYINHANYNTVGKVAYRLTEFNTGKNLLDFKFANRPAVVINYVTYYPQFDGTLGNLSIVNATDGSTFITYNGGTSSFKFIEVPFVDNGYFITGQGTTYSVYNGGVYPNKIDAQPRYLKYNNGFYIAADVPTQYSKYSKEYGDFIFILRSTCPLGQYPNSYSGCIPCLSNSYCPSNTIDPVPCPYGTQSVENSSDISSCTSCNTPTGDYGTSPIYWFNIGCRVVGCDTFDEFAIGTLIDASGACRNVCNGIKDASGKCAPPSTVTPPSTVSACTTTDPNAISAARDGSGVCRSTCKPGFTKNGVGTCVACTVTPGDTGTTPTYLSSGCTVSACTTIDPNATGAEPDGLGACRNTCRDGYSNDVSGSCIMCPTGDSGTYGITYSATNSCTVYRCGFSGKNGYSLPDANGVCRAYCNDNYFLNSSSPDICVPCVSSNDDYGTYAKIVNGTCTRVSCSFHLWGWNVDVNVINATLVNNDCHIVCKAGFQRNSDGIKCDPCAVTGDTGTTPSAYSSGCTVSACTTSDPNAYGSTLDATGACRNVCNPGYLKNASGVCAACAVTGDIGTTPTSYSSGCTVSACTTTDSNASGAAPDWTGLCRNTCKPGTSKNGVGTCVACSVTTPGDPGTTPTYSSGCTENGGCTTTDPNAAGAARFMSSGNQCINICKPGYQKNNSGTCVPCPPGLNDMGTVITSVTYSGSCIPTSCTTTDPNASSSVVDSSYVCRNICRTDFQKDSNGTCVRCPFSLTYGVCACSSSGNDVNAIGSKIVNGSCINTCTTGYEASSGGLCRACQVPPRTFITYFPSSGCDILSCIKYDANAYEAVLSNKRCTMSCKYGYTLTTTGCTSTIKKRFILQGNLYIVAFSTPPVDSGGDIQVTIYANYIDDINLWFTGSSENGLTGAVIPYKEYYVQILNRLKATTYVRGMGGLIPSLEFYAYMIDSDGNRIDSPVDSVLNKGLYGLMPVGYLIPDCPAGQTNTLVNLAQACVACVVTPGDIGTTPSAYSSGCTVSACTTTDTNASGASPDGAGLCRNTCKPGFTKNGVGTCVACTVTPGDAGTAPFTYSSGCTVSACTSTDGNASGVAPDGSGVCRNTCKPGFTKNGVGTCVACGGGDTGTRATYSSGCTVSTCATTDGNASGATPDGSGVCRNTCKPGFTRNASGTCVACTVTTPGDPGTTPTYSTGCTAAGGCTTTDVNALSAAPDGSGACRNTCKSGFTRNASGVCVSTTGVCSTGTMALTPQNVAGFGYATAMSSDGNTVIVTGYATGGNISPYVYRFASGSWDTGTPLTPPQNVQRFGYATAMSSDGNTVIVTAYSSNGMTPYVYKFVSGAWGTATPLPSITTPGFGKAVDMSSDGNTVVVTGYSSNGMTPYVYKFVSGAWGTTALTSKTTAGFGNATAMSSDGNTVIVTCYGGGVPYIYKFTSGSWDTGTPLTVPTTEITFGKAVGMSSDGNAVIITTSGTGLAPYVYRFS